MPSKTSTGRPWVWRRRYVIDRPLQMGIAAHLMAGLGGVALLCAAALYVFLGGQTVPGLDPLRRFLLIANATYFVLAAGILTLLTVLLTHRFAGPAFVMQQAIRGMLTGDFGKRLNLRRKDYLKDLAADLDQLRHAWVRHDETTRIALADLQVALDKRDFEQAKTILTGLREGLLVDPESVIREDAPDPDGDPDDADVRKRETSLAG